MAYLEIYSADASKVNIRVAGLSGSFAYPRNFWFSVNGGSIVATTTTNKYATFSPTVDIRTYLSSSKINTVTCDIYGVYGSGTKKDATVSFKLVPIHGTTSNAIDSFSLNTSSDGTGTSLGKITAGSGRYSVLYADTDENLFVVSVSPENGYATPYKIYYNSEGETTLNTTPATFNTGKTDSKGNYLAKEVSTSFVRYIKIDGTESETLTSISDARWAKDTIIASQGYVKITVGGLLANKTYQLGVANNSTSYANQTVYSDQTCTTTTSITIENSTYYTKLSDLYDGETDQEYKFYLKDSNFNNLGSLKTLKHQDIQANFFTDDAYNTIGVNLGDDSVNGRILVSINGNSTTPLEVRLYNSSETTLIKSYSKITTSNNGYYSFSDLEAGTTYSLCIYHGTTKLKSRSIRAKDKITATLDANGGVFSSGSVLKYKYAYSDDIYQYSARVVFSSADPKPSRAGYKFMGWSLTKITPSVTANGTYGYDEDNTAKTKTYYDAYGDITFYAVWRITVLKPSTGTFILDSRDANTITISCEFTNLQGGTYYLEASTSSTFSTIDATSAEYAYNAKENVPISGLKPLTYYYIRAFNKNGDNKSDPANYNFSSSANGKYTYFCWNTKSSGKDNDNSVLITEAIFSNCVSANKWTILLTYIHNKINNSCVATQYSPGDVLKASDLNQAYTYLKLTYPNKDSKGNVRKFQYGDPIYASYLIEIKNAFNSTISSWK